MFQIRSSGSRAPFYDFRFARENLFLVFPSLPFASI